MLKKILKFSAAVMTAFFVLFLLLKTYGDANYYAAYDTAWPLDVKITDTSDVDKTKEVFGIERQQKYKRTAFSIEGSPGDRVPCVMTQPLGFDGKSKLPTIIFIHGSGQRKDFVEEICTPFNQGGFAMVSYDQWNCGERKLPKEATLKKITAWYERGGKAVNDARRIADYLVTRPDVDPDRLYLVGASYGAMTGTHVLAFDKRFKAGVLVVGGGNFKIMLDAPLIRNNVPHALLAVLKPVANWLGGPFDPIRDAAKTGPTPVLMQCGEDDTLVWPEAGKALFAELADPKELRWYKVDHPGLRKTDGPEIIRMLDDGLNWLQTKAGLPVTTALPAAAAPVAASSEAPAPAPAPAQ